MAVKILLMLRRMWVDGTTYRWSEAPGMVGISARRELAEANLVTGAVVGTMDAAKLLALIDNRWISHIVPGIRGQFVVSALDGAAGRQKFIRPWVPENGPASVKEAEADGCDAVRKARHHSEDCGTIGPSNRGQ